MALLEALLRVLPGTHTQEVDGTRYVVREAVQTGRDRRAHEPDHGPDLLETLRWDTIYGTEEASSPPSPVLKTDGSSLLEIVVEAGRIWKKRISKVRTKERQCWHYSPTVVMDKQRHRNLGGEINSPIAPVEQHRGNVQRGI